MAHQRAIRDDRSSLRRSTTRAARHRIGALVVTNSAHRIVGIVAKRDVISCPSGDANAMQRSASEIMSRDVLTCGPNETVEDVAFGMVQAGIRHLPVTSAGELVGVISARDILLLRAQMPAAVPVSHAMAQNKPRCSDPISGSLGRKRAAKIRT